MEAAKKILLQNFKSHKKKPLKHYTGWSYLIAATIFPMTCINRYMVIAENYWHYLLPR